MGLTETWGLDDIMDSEMGIHGYRLHRKDRSVVRNKQGGGVALYVRSNMVLVEWEELNIKHCERLWVRLYM